MPVDPDQILHHAFYARNFHIARPLTTPEHRAFSELMGRAGEDILRNILSDQEDPLPVQRRSND